MLDMSPSWVQVDVEHVKYDIEFVGAGLGGLVGCSVGEGVG